jgi:3-hydroxybutyryl-CoA dehydrogenase
MGNGIAQVAASAGYDVVMQDVSAAGLAKGLATIDKNLGRMVEKGKVTEAADASAARARITTSAEVVALAGCDLVIEAATENVDLKFRIFENLSPVVRPGALLASNTSSISITAIAAHTDRPDQVMGMHFMNPVPVMQLVELIRGLATSDETYATVGAAEKRMGKTTVLGRDMPGFIVNRVLMPYINEAVYALYEGIGSVEDIDTAMKLGTNVPMGPAHPGRLHRPRHLPGHHGGAAQRHGRRQQVPAVPAAPQVRRGGLARAQVRARASTTTRVDAKTRCRGDTNIRWSLTTARADRPAHAQPPQGVERDQRRGAPTSSRSARGGPGLWTPRPRGGASPAPASQGLRRGGRHRRDGRPRAPARPRPSRPRASACSSRSRPCPCR